MAWTDERVEQLKTLWIGGASASQIAKELGGVTRNAVIGKVHRLGLSSRNQGKPEAAEKPAKPAPAVEEAAPVAAAAPEPVAEAAPVEVPPAASRPVEVEKAAAPVEAVAEEESDDTLTADLPAEMAAPEGMVMLPSENHVNIAEIDRDAHKLTLMELTERTCKWPIGDPSRGEFYFCGHPVVPGKPYCKGHTAAAYQPMSSRRDRDRARSIQRPAITRSA